MTEKPGKIVRHAVDLENLPPLTEAQKANLAALAARPESEIDLSDIPEMTDEQFEKAVKFRGRFYRPVKQQLTTRLDADVVAWLKSQGKGYQSRMNAILGKEMLASLKKDKTC